ncbi:FAD-binding and (Fe-S)-binding domain-containing protein [Pseudonocardia kunmingensis]|uniref:FAD/FMN-containing dehydrogenase n=1 Tax=Pseudonocardia kunmingensis TaxID=630975 RepID=A0A543D9H4_9PSEU|nr:FAD-binding and (Fe-S)-binding domain-containing protein [Pseudonocardia kunmingensis]TQM05928.1 FAD/FMN-containing dehydrogenase [Pseudonocardia kunmingensis]
MIEKALRESVRGEVAFDTATRALYATDASNYRRVPQGVVFPRDADDVAAVLAACRAHGVPLTARGRGTSIAGNAVGPGVVLDTSRHLTRILEIDPERRTARVEPGVVLDELQAAARPHGLRFGPDPSTHSRCTIGGMIGNNACGSHSVAWGKTSENVEELDVLLADGTRMQLGAGQEHPRLQELVSRHLGEIRREFSGLSRRVSGYALDQLLPENGFHVARSLVGSEGTCATVLGATVSLVPLPAATVLLVLGFPDAIAAAHAVPRVLPHHPGTVEGMDAELLALFTSRPGRGAVDLPDGGAWLFVEMTGDTQAEAAERAHVLAAELRDAATAQVITEPAAQRVAWRVREEGAGLATRLADGSEAWPGWEDAAVPPEHLGAYLEDFAALLRRHDRKGVTYGHFGEGCLHVRIDFDLVSDRGRAGFRAFSQDIADVVVAHGGSLSGEHGDGRARAELLPRMYSEPVMRAFGAFKAIWDPEGLLNPGVLVQPDPVDAGLRFHPPRERGTLLAFAHDGGSIDQAARRCVGVGKCVVKQPSGVMCPSFAVTGAEEHSTRGRAHLLMEMLRGETITDGWRSTEVRDALDLCLSCKGCKSDCPVDVDMASYKSEFLAHHYAGRLRPASHYSMGWLPLWARIASLAPGLVNLAGRTPGLRALLKRAGGIAPEREIPRFAPATFTGAFRRRPPRPHAARPTVVLWPDTFNNHLTPEVLRDATEVLEAAGFEVLVPPGQVCCGLTWITTGQLRTARRVLEHTVAVLRPYVDAGLPVVVLEPSCAAALRADATEVLPDGARALAEHTLTLAEFLQRHAPDWAPPALARAAITQQHCHQHADLGFTADEALLAKAGVANRTLDSGCCGLAGNFGFEREHYAVSTAVGERVLLPAVRAADADTLVVADGFSCRTQIAQQTPRRALHLAQVLRMALRSGRPPADRPPRFRADRRGGAWFRGRRVNTRGDVR